jgi:excisionase family DNA binding protein
MLEALRPLVAELVAEELDRRQLVQNDDEPSPWMTVREGADHVHVKEGTMRKWVDRGVVPSYKIEGRRLIRRDDLDERPVRSRETKPRQRGNAPGRDTEGMSFDAD